MREAGVGGNGKIGEQIVGKIYNFVVYNVGGHAGHISEEVVTKISETHTIQIKQLVNHGLSPWINIITEKSLFLHHHTKKTISTSFELLFHFFIGSVFGPSY